MNKVPASLEPTAARSPQLRRDRAHKAIAGVASGIGNHLGISPTWARATFVALTAINGLGVFLYAIMWVLVPAGLPRTTLGLEAAERSGMRPRQRTAPLDAGMLFSVGLIVIGVGWVLVTGGVLLPSGMFWPMVIGGVGVVMIWLQADRVSETAPQNRSDGFWARLSHGSVIASLLRLFGGLMLVGLGIWWILATQIGLAQLPAVLASAAVLLAGVLVVAAPWLYRVRQKVRIADQERLRAEAHADMAAHLHDSVLQTLALIQRQSGDQAAVASLARRQERELRTWLYGATSAPQTLRGALEQIVVEVEELFPIAVEVICVGDLELDETTRALTQAVREAVLNAAKHSGAERVDVYAEVEPAGIEIFIRDRGKGFNLQGIGTDRMGVKQSIQARMERHGGSARIRTAPGEGTEVKLEMSR